MWLRGHGRLPWAQTVSVLKGLNCAWADLDGWHQNEPAPTDVPTATHLWAWSDQQWARVRIDGDETIVATLSNDKENPASPNAVQVDVEIAIGTAWGQDEQRLPSKSRDLGAFRPVLLDVLGQSHCTFVHFGNKFD